MHVKVHQLWNALDFEGHNYLIWKQKVAYSYCSTETSPSHLHSELGSCQSLRALNQPSIRNQDEWMAEDSGSQMQMLPRPLAMERQHLVINVATFPLSKWWIGVCIRILLFKLIFGCGLFIAVLINLWKLLLSAPGPCCWFDRSSAPINSSMKDTSAEVSELWALTWH